MFNAKGVKIAGIVAMVAGLLMIIAGGVTWGLVSSQLVGGAHHGGRGRSRLRRQEVNGPLDAYYQADIIKHHVARGHRWQDLRRSSTVRTRCVPPR